MQKLIVRPVIVESLQDDPKRKRTSTPRLYPSDAGSCGRKVMLRVMGATSSPFPLIAKQAMDNGNAYEDSTLKLLQKKFGEDGIATQVEFKTEYWSGKADFIIGHLSENPIIIEHKATGDKWFDYKESLPQSKHVMQLAMYYHLYLKLYGIKPTLVLYYRAWSQWAEFVLTVDEETNVSWEGVVGIMSGGEIDEKTRSAQNVLNINKEVKVLERYYRLGSLPRRVKEVDREDAGCTFKGKPSCQYYAHCWPKEFEKDEVVLDKELFG